VSIRLGAGKRYVERNWIRRWAYTLCGEVHVPGWIRLQHVLRELANLELERPSIRLLDAGSGRGDLLTYLGERHPGWHLVGVELDPHRLKMAEEIRRKLRLSNVSYLRANVCDLPFHEEFDVVLSSDVLEHVSDDRRALASMTGALKAGGYVVITSPSVPQPKHLPLVAWRERRIGFDPSDYGHVRQGYSMEGLKCLFEAEELEPTRIRYTYGRWGTLAFDIFFSIGDNRPNPVLFASLFPILKVLACLDLRDNPVHGAGILGIGKKKDKIVKVH
jgi:ubiquinone/menaquinone biosynthesis C-methylase UbiE